MVIDSKDAPNGDPFKCMIACKQDGGRKIIEIFDIYSDLKQRENIRSILYQENGNNLVIKISENFEKIVFSNGIEHYILIGSNQDFFP